MTPMQAAAARATAAAQPDAPTTEILTAGTGGAGSSAGGPTLKGSYDELAGKHELVVAEVERLRTHTMALTAELQNMVANELEESKQRMIQHESRLTEVETAVYNMHASGSIRSAC